MMWRQIANSFGLPAALLGAAAAIAVAQPQVAVALTVREVSYMAEKITVLIDGELPGSGVIVARDGNTYYVLTTKHVAERAGGYKAVTPDGRRYPISSSTVQKLPDADLAVFQFTSEKDYQIATLADYNLAGEQFVFVSGWPAPSRSIQNRARLLSFGKLIPQEMRHLLSAAPFGEDSQGYELLYTSITQNGMSGGPVLDTSGRVIGIHGRAEGEVIYDDLNSGSPPLKIGFSLGMSTGTFLLAASKAGIAAKLTVEKSPPEPIALSEIGELYLTSLSIPDANNPDAVYWADQGNKMLRLGQLAMAGAAYDRALQINPNFYQAWYGKGLMLTYWKKYQEAIAAYEKALGIIERQQQTEADPNLRARLQKVGENVLQLRGNLLQELGFSNPPARQSRTAEPQELPVPASCLTNPSECPSPEVEPVQPPLW